MSGHIFQASNKLCHSNTVLLLLFGLSKLQSDCMVITSFCRETSRIYALCWSCFDSDIRDLTRTLCRYLNKKLPAEASEHNNRPNCNPALIIRQSFPRWFTLGSLCNIQLNRQIGWSSFSLTQHSNSGTKMKILLLRQSNFDLLLRKCQLDHENMEF